jgi:hypothetical protein
MAFEEATGSNISKIAGEAITGARFVDLQSDDTIDMCDAAADLVIGVAAETVAVGVVCPVTVQGIAMVESGATLSVGDPCSSGTNGVLAAASAVGGEIIAGIVQEDCVSGDIVGVLLQVRTVDA